MGLNALGPACKQDASGPASLGFFGLEREAAMTPRRNFGDGGKKDWGKLVLRERIELSASPLPRGCSTTELPQQARAAIAREESVEKRPIRRHRGA